MCIYTYIYRSRVCCIFLKTHGDKFVTTHIKLILYFLDFLYQTTCSNISYKTRVNWTYYFVSKKHEKTWLKIKTILLNMTTEIPVNLTTYLSSIIFPMIKNKLTPYLLAVIYTLIYFFISLSINLSQYISMCILGDKFIDCYLYP